MRDNPPIQLNRTRVNSSRYKRATNQKISTITSQITPSTLTSGSRRHTRSEGPSRFQINPEPSRNPFCQARDFGGLYVEITNNKTWLTPSNNTKFTQSSIKQLLSQRKLLSIRISTTPKGRDPTKAHQQDPSFVHTRRKKANPKTSSMHKTQRRNQKAPERMNLSHKLVDNTPFLP